MTTRFLQHAFVIAGLGLSLLSFNLHAQLKSGAPITVVVPFAPGGSVDLVPRIVAQRMSASMGVPVVVENKPGAGGNIGAEFVAKAKPDGQTLLAFAGGVLAVNPTLNPSTPFTYKNFAPISMLAWTPNVFVVNTDVKASNMKELIELARSAPGTINFSTPGVGTSPHLCVELLASREGLDLVHIPFKGGAAAIRALLAKRVQMACSNMPSVVSYVRSGRLHALAVTSKTRSALFPDVPTVIEAGIANFEVLGWFGMAAPAGTPAATIEALNAEVIKALADPQVIERLKSLGLTPAGNSPQEFAKYIESEATRWGAIVKKANITIK